MGAWRFSLGNRTLSLDVKRGDPVIRLLLFSKAFVSGSVVRIVVVFSFTVSIYVVVFCNCLLFVNLKICSSIDL